MGAFDFSLETLKTYQGISPKPDDFESFWDDSIKEALSEPAEISLVKSEFSCDFASCYSLYFNSVKGSRQHAKLIVPVAGGQKYGAVLKFHGYSGNSGQWTDGLYYAAAGYVYAALDCRGQRGYSEDRGTVSRDNYQGHFIRGINDGPENMTMRNTFLDTVKLAQVVKSFDFVDADNVSAMGFSQGGALTTVCAALVPGIKKAAIVYPFLSDYKRVWQMDLAVAAYEELKTFFRVYDPKHEFEDEIFMKLGYIDIQNFAHRIKGEVRFYTGLMDTVCPPSTQFAAYNKIKSKKSMTIYPDFGHEAITGINDEIFEFLTGKNIT